jgi:hypothetical protein
MFTRFLEGADERLPLLAETRWRRYVPRKHRLTQDIHSATSQKTFFIVTAVKASNRTWHFLVTCFRYRDSVVGITTSYGLDVLGVAVRVPVGSSIFSTASRPALGSTQPLNQWVPGVLSPGVKRPGRETDHSPPASAEVKKIWICTSTPP